MDWNKHWNEALHLPRAQHWTTKGLRLVAVGAAGAAAIQSIAGGALSGFALLTMAGAVAAFAGAFALDAAICAWRVSESWFDENLDEIAPGHRPARAPSTFQARLTAGSR